MLHEDEKILRLRQQRSKQAIDLAMEGRWQEAVEVNKSIIEAYAEDVDAYNRLGRAYLELGEYSQAKVAYSRAVELDPYNAIARKNLQRLSYLKETTRAEAESHKVEPQHFIEEIGKAGVVTLYDLAPKEILAKMVAGDSVSLKIDSSSLIVENGRGEYLGLVEPRHALRLVKLMKGGNRYTAAIVSSTVDLLTVIIREAYQDPSQAGRFSFPPKGLEEVRPYASDRMLKLGAEYDEEEAEEPGYTVIGGEEVEVLPEEPAVDEDAAGDEV